MSIINGILSSHGLVSGLDILHWQITQFRRTTLFINQKLDEKPMTTHKNYITQQTIVACWLVRLEMWFTWQCCVCACSIESRPGRKMVSVRMQSCVSSVLLLNVLYSAVSALYFHIGETEKKCFIEEIPDETMIIGECPRAQEVLG